MTEADAKALIEAAQKGDKTAFEALVVLYYDTIFKFAMKWCGDVNNAEDITQNACMKLARSIDSYNFKAAFTSWLYRLVVNVAIDWQRSQARHEGAELSDEAGHVGVSASRAEDNVYAQEVMAAVYALPEKEKTALLLVMGEGLSHREAAQSMDCKESTVSWYIHEARKKLDAQFGKDEQYG